MKFSLACGDVMPGCTSRFTSTSREVLMAEVGAHARADHGIVDLDPQVVRTIDSKIVSVPA